MDDAGLLPPCGITSRLWVFLTEPAGGKARLIFSDPGPICGGPISRLAVFQKLFGRKNSSPFLAEDDPLGVIGETTVEISDAADIAFLNDQKFFTVKPACISI